MAELCPKCKGKKTTTELDIMRARSRVVRCEECKGTGFKKEVFNGNGIRVLVPKCQVMIFQHMVDNYPVATLELRVYPCVNDKGVPLYRYHPGDRRQVTLLWAELVRMDTRSKYRKMGIMSQLVEAARGDEKIQYIKSSWDDSTHEGIKFCEKMGFKHVGNELVWRRENGYYPQRPGVPSSEDSSGGPSSDSEHDSAEVRSGLDNQERGQGSSGE